MLQMLSILLTIAIDPNPSGVGDGSMACDVAIALWTRGRTPAHEFMNTSSKPTEYTECVAEIQAI